MWLIDTHTLALKRFQDDRKAVGKYAILSHRWQREEVLFDDLAIGRNVQVPPATKLKFGFAKIENSCAKARDDGYRYLWSDTCCINKTSSAELSEAIASMWRWYSDAAVCYAYLCDISLDDRIGSENSQSPEELLRLLRPSVWFRRGWTLQELIAPSIVIFFDQNWSKIGLKSDMTKILETITGIGENALLNRDMVNSYCVAKRMAWAAKRETTRIEDEAYCLLGLFGVNMPMMYGEGRRAFLRLQEEIVRSSTDHSIFAWIPTQESAVHHFSALFAPDTRCFLGLRMHKKIIEDLADDEAYELTNRGLRISLPVHVTGDYLLAMLNCVSRRLHDRDEVIVLSLKKHERQNKLAPKQNSRIVCEIERQPDNRTWFSRQSLEPLQWMDLTILRHGLTSEIRIRFEILPVTSPTFDFSGKILESTPDLGGVKNVMTLANPTGRPLSGGHVKIQGYGVGGPVAYLSIGQCLRQANSFATFRMLWSTAPVSEHQLLLQQPSTLACTDLFSENEETDRHVAAEAVLLDDFPDRRSWLVRIWGGKTRESVHQSEHVSVEPVTSRKSVKEQLKLQKREARAKAKKAQRFEALEDVPTEEI